MTATIVRPASDSDTTAVRLNFTVIEKKVADLLDLDIEIEPITDQMLADLFDVSRETISRWRNGHRNPRLVTAFSIASLLDLSIEQLTGQAVNASRA